MNLTQRVRECRFGFADDTAQIKSAVETLTAKMNEVGAAMYSNMQAQATEENRQEQDDSVIDAELADE